MPRGWIGVDFDGTIATYGTWLGATHVGEPIMPMVERVRHWLDEGWEVRIVTARCYPLLLVQPGEDPRRAARISHPFQGRDSEGAVDAIRAWCREHLGRELAVTCVKDFGMVVLFDDRARQVITNTGAVVGVTDPHWTP